jgi:hypothetical protein
LQASSAKQNYLAVMKISSLGQTKAAADRQKEQQQQEQKQRGGDGSDSDEDMLAGSDLDSDAGGEAACQAGRLTSGTS